MFKGRNTITFNLATMQEALQDYINGNLMAGNVVKVSDIEETTENSCKVFKVKVDEAEDVQEKRE